MGLLRRYAAAATSAIHFHFLRWWREYLIILAALIVFCVIAYCALLTPPRNFPSGQIVTITPDSSLPSVALQLDKQYVIRHPSIFTFIVRVLGGARRVNAGSYRFVQPQNAITIALRIIRGESGIPPVRVTFPEGQTVSQMSTAIHNALPGIAEDDFVGQAAQYEGYLFPDTYVFSAGDTAASIITALRANFEARITPLAPEISASRHTLQDIVTMASLLEAETKTPEARRMVAGILWNRIKLGMALQVDAVPETYHYVGLPPAPVNNPGLDAINAATNPKKTSSLYYLTGTDGTMHYATTFAEHQANQKKYLK